MKERIVIEDLDVVKMIKTGIIEDDKLCIAAKTEQIPETWEELQNECKKISLCGQNEDYIAYYPFKEATHCIEFGIDGVITFVFGEIEKVLCNNISYGDMLSIIKNLWGAKMTIEEKIKAIERELGYRNRLIIYGGRRSGKNCLKKGTTGAYYEDLLLQSKK